VNTLRQVVGQGHRAGPEKSDLLPLTCHVRPAHQKGPLTPGERNFVVLFATLVLGLFIAEIARNYQPVKLTILLIAC